MNIRKFWKQAILSCAAAFWASCSNTDSSITQVEAVGDNSTESSSSHASKNLSSSSKKNSSSSVAKSSSSKAKSSSSVAESSSSKAEPASSEAKFHLASDPSIACEEKIEYLLTGEPKTKEELCEYYKNVVENKELDASINKINDFEDLLESNDCAEDEEKVIASFAALYRPPINQSVKIEPEIANKKVTYKCEDNKEYYYAAAGYVFSAEEYDELYPGKIDLNSSSSAEQSSSSDEKDTSTTLCQKTDFISSIQLNNKLDSIKTAKTSSLIDESSASAGTKCLVMLKNGNYKENNIDVSEQNLNFPGLIAKTQICDGEKTSNKRYQDRFDAVVAKIDEAIDKCVDLDKGE